MKPQPILLVSYNSIGIYNYAKNLARALKKLGYDIPVTDRPQGGNECLHFQMGNSTRRLWRYLADLSSPALITLHDVVPRHRLLRKVLGPVQSRLYSRHIVVVHSEYSKEMLEAFGFHGDVRVIHHGASDIRYPENERVHLRRSISPDGKPILISAGVLKKEKGSVEILQACHLFPEFLFLFMGRAADAETEKLLRSPPENVIHHDRLNDQEFMKHLAASDVLLNFRRDSVGEVSGPVVQAHGLGTPVAGYATGFMPEYCGDQDYLFPPELTVENALNQLMEQFEPDRRLPPTDPLITTWENAADRYLTIYRESGCLA